MLTGGDLTLWEGLAALPAFLRGGIAAEVTSSREGFWAELRLPLEGDAAAAVGAVAGAEPEAGAGAGAGAEAGAGTGPGAGSPCTDAVACRLRAGGLISLRERDEG